MALGVCNNLCKVAEGYPQYRTRTSCTFTNTNNDYVEVSANSDFDCPTSDFSISGWVKFTADASSTDDTDGYAIIDAGVFQATGWYLHYNDAAGDDEQIIFKTNQEGSSDNCTMTGDLDHDIWYHFVATYDFSATTGKLYLDGALNKTASSQEAPITNSTNIYIGGSTTNEIPAIQCEIVYWKGVTLSAGQVAGLYNNGRPRHGLSCERSYIKGYWKLNAADATGSNNVVDSSGTGHHGTCGAAKSDGQFDTTDVPS